MVSTVTMIVLAILSITVIVLRRNRLRPLPPGPPGWPIIGNLFDLQQEFPWITYSNWSKTYGNIMFMRALTTPMLIVSSPDIAFDLMDKRSAIYSSKPTSVVDEMTGWDFALSLMPYGQRWRNIRRNVHEHFHQMVTPNYRDKQTKHIHAFLRQCLGNTAKQFNSTLVRQLLATTVLDVVYGIRIKDMDDDYIKTIVEALEVFGESKISGKYWVDFMPVLKYVPRWVPGAAFAKFAARSRPVVEEMLNRPFNAVRDGETHNDCVALSMLAKIESQPDIEKKKEEEMYAKYATGILYSGAVETTFSLLQTFFCGMAMRPDIQQRARQELDSVVGPERLPTYDDQDHLPYVQAIFMECLRWMTTVPLGVPHSATQDDYYDGYFIPSGTIIVPNAWHMLHNPEEYPEPDKFNPDRFIKDGKINPAIRDPATIAFGFGRRSVRSDVHETGYSQILFILYMLASICPGRHFAKDTAFLVIASILHTFDVKPSIDENGHELDPTPQLHGSMVSFPSPLNYRLKSRSEAAEKLVHATEL
ncbi:cytochrome P450 [Irpex rosettiformis]|uniref:Cytochrome P450 n=1 Tax=Irpex rosettiformis TaxID=378272 RepID=A0ACB8TTC2_9APHY|nr:cytochrome P450 [Irpex rosettiformis]